MITQREKKSAAKKAFNLMKAIPRDKDGNPLTLDDTIRSVILKSPDNFKYRDDALDIIYCVLGTGIGWNEHGRLGDRTPNNYINTPPNAGGQGIWSKDFGLDEVFDNLGTWSKKIKKEIIADQNTRLAKAIQVIDEIDIRVHRYRRNRESWFPISWYSCHLCCPENVQVDFLDGALETISLIIDTNPDLNTDKWFKQENNKMVAEHMKILLLAQKDHMRKK